MNLLDRANKVLSPALGHYSTLEIKSGLGCYLYDYQGQAYLDFAAGIAVASTGHCHPDVVKAIQNQAQTLIHAGACVVYYEQPIALAERLGQIMGPNLDCVFFSQSGSEAIEASIKLAKYTTKKSGILAFRGAFHGRTLGALSLTTSKDRYRQGYEPLLDEIQFFPYPYCYRCPWQKHFETCEMHCLHQLEKKLQEIKNQIAGVIIEPILGEGGYVNLPPNFLKRLREICTQNHVLLILDEIQTGFGRTGKWFAYQHAQIVPDIVAIAKGMASGLPLGACVASKELMAKWTTGAHGGTYPGNPVTCAASLATINVLEPLISQVSDLGAKALAYLKEKLGSHSKIGEIRGQGLMIGLEFVKDKITKEPDPDHMKAILKACYDNHLIVISCGLHDNVLRLIPPLIISEEELFKGLNILLFTIFNVPKAR